MIDHKDNYFIFFTKNLSAFMYSSVHVIMFLLQPVPNMINPYVEAPKTCVLCQYQVKLDYKVRLMCSLFDY